MIATLLVTAAGAYTLPGYVLGQPLEDVRIVVPNGKSRETWHLRCAGEAGAPSGLELSQAEKAAGVRRCWTTEVVDGVEQRAAFPRRDSRRSTQEIELLDEKVVRITKVYYVSDTDRSGNRFVWSQPEAERIDRLKTRDGH